MLAEIGKNNCKQCKFGKNPIYTDAKVRCSFKNPRTQFLPQDFEEEGFMGYGYWVCHEFESK